MRAEDCFRTTPSPHTVLSNLGATGDTGAAAGAGTRTESRGATISIERKIPNRIHFIWLGPSPLPMRYLWNILSCHQLNTKHYEVNLWVNPEYFITPDSDEYNRFSFLQKQGIKLRSFHQLFMPAADTKLTADDALLLKCIDQTYLKRPVIAADILRLRILADPSEGGFYYDTDTLFKKALPEILECTEGTSLIIDETVVNLSSGKEIHSFCNSFIASMASGREIKHLIRILIANLRYLTQFGIEGLEGISKEQILRNTGPFLLDYLCQLVKTGSAENTVNAITHASIILSCVALNLIFMIKPG